MIKLVQLNKKQFIYFSLLFFIFLNGIIKYANAAEMNPEEVVKQYYIADFNGVRLSGNTYAAITPLVSWKNEPGWDYAFIVDKIKINKIDRQISKDTIIEVKYHVIGIIGEELAEYDFYEVIDFSLSNKGKQWKINAPIPPPHISVNAAVKNLEELIKVEREEMKDNNRINKFKHIIERLKKVK